MKKIEVVAAIVFYGDSVLCVQKKLIKIDVFYTFT